MVSTRAVILRPNCRNPFDKQIDCPSDGHRLMRSTSWNLAALLKLSVPSSKTSMLCHDLHSERGLRVRPCAFRILDDWPRNTNSRTDILSLVQSIGQSLLLRADGLVFELGFRHLANGVTFCFISCFRLFLDRHAIRCSLVVSLVWRFSCQGHPA